MKKKTIVIIPALNEELGFVIDRISKLELGEILILAAGKNHLSSICSAKKLTILTVPKGNGRAIKKGLSYALCGNYQNIFRIDGDGQYLPELIPEAQKILENHQWVLGSRYHPQSNGDGAPIDRLLFNKTLTPLISSLCGWPLTDCLTGFWGFRREFIEKIFSYLTTKGYGMTMEIILRAWKMQLSPPQEIFHPRIYNGQKKYSSLYHQKNLKRRIKRISEYYLLLASLCQELEIEDKLKNLNFYRR